MPSFFGKISGIFSKKKLPVFETYESIAELGKRTNRLLVTIDDKVYDLTDYNSHPGGYKVMELCKGKDASEVFKKYHWPKGDARKIMKKYKIGTLDLLKGVSKTSVNNSHAEKDKDWLEY